MSRWLNWPSWLSAGSDGPIIRRIVEENARRHWRGYGTAMVMTVIAAGTTALIAYLVGDIINTALQKQQFGSVVVLSLSWMGLFALRGFATYWQDILVAQTGNRITAETQQRIFAKLMEQDVQYFADRHSTEFMANAVVGAASMSHALNQLVLAVGRDMLTLAGLLCLMVWQDPLLSLIGLLVLPPALIGVEALTARAKSVAATQFRGATAMLATMQETVQGFRIVKAFGLEDGVLRRVDSNIQNIERASNELSRIAHRASPLVEGFSGIAVGLACLYGGYRVTNSNAAPGELVSFMMALMLTLEPARRLARLKIEIGTSLVVSQALYNLFDSPPRERDDTAKPELRVGRGRVEFLDVDFAYRANVPVLDSLSFVAAPGRLTALVGASGAGKTTVFNLLLRLNEVGRGRIEIDGQDTSQVPRASLRGQIAYMGQEIYLFNGTIRDNILVGRPAADEAELVAAAKAAFAHEFIMGLPGGYDAPVGEGGSQFSLGQRQRIAIARALIKDAPIVLLDEPTASLDSESEKYVQVALRRLCAGKTTLAIAHRLNTIRDADCIHVIDGGVVVESGTHDSLLQRNGRYANFFNLQFPHESVENVR